MLALDTIVFVDSKEFVSGDLGVSFVIVPESVYSKIKQVDAQKYSPEWVISTFKR